MAWTLMKEGGEAENFGAAHKEFMIDSISDIDNEPTQYGSIAPGSFAYTAGYDTIFQKNAINEWVEASEGGEGPSTVTWSNVTGKPFTSDVDGNVTATGNMKIHYNGQEINVGQAITSGGGGGGGLSTMTITMTEEQIMSFLSDMEVDFDAEQFENFDQSNPPDVLFLYGEMPGEEPGPHLSIYLSKTSNMSIMNNEIGYGGTFAMNGGENNMVITLTVSFETDSGNVFEQAHGSLEKIVTLNMNAEIEVGSVPTYADYGEIEWLPPSGGGSTVKTITMTEDQMAQYMSDGRLIITEDQIEDFSEENIPDVILLHGEMGTQYMNVYLQKAQIQKTNIALLVSYGTMTGTPTDMDVDSDVQSRNMVCVIGIMDHPSMGEIKMGLAVESKPILFSYEAEPGSVPMTTMSGDIEWNTMPEIYIYYNQSYNTVSGSSYENVTKAINWHYPMGTVQITSNGNTVHRGIMLDAYYPDRGEAYFRGIPSALVSNDTQALTFLCDSENGWSIYTPR